jgi:DNA-binding IclR family transcriptional regulator
MTTAVNTQVASGTVLVAVGERLGLYEAISEDAVTATELARRTGAPTRFISDWLTAQAREGYLTHDAASGRYATWCSWPRSN